MLSLRVFFVNLKKSIAKGFHFLHAIYYMSVYFHPFPVLAFFGGLVMLSLGIFALFRRRVSGSGLFSLLMFSGGSAAILYYFELVCIPLSYKVTFLKLEFFGITTITVLWLLTAAHYYGLKKFFKPKNILLLFVIPVTTIVLVWTNEFHHFFWTNVKTEQIWGLIVLNNSYGFGTGSTLHIYMGRFWSGPSCFSI